MADTARHPDAVIFDMDGLLFDSEALYQDAFLSAAGKLGHALTSADFLALVGRSWSTNQAVLQRQLGSSAVVETFRVVWMRHYEDRRPGLQLKPGAMRLLSRLDELRLPRAICTSSTNDDVKRNLQGHGLTGRFDAIVAAGDYPRGKPAPDPFLRAAERLGMEPANCLALEDSFNGVRAAAAAGMRTVMVPDLLAPTDEIRALCEFVAADLHAVCDRLA
jgi:HAD superfamily hydrolase (TIGR01509 family)